MNPEEFKAHMAKRRQAGNTVNEDPKEFVDVPGKLNVKTTIRINSMEFEEGANQQKVIEDLVGRLRWNMDNFWVNSVSFAKGLYGHNAPAAKVSHDIKAEGDSASGTVVVTADGATVALEPGADLATVIKKEIIGLLDKEYYNGVFDNQLQYVDGLVDADCDSADVKSKITYVPPKGKPVTFVTEAGRRLIGNLMEYYYKCEDCGRDLNEDTMKDTGQGYVCPPCWKKHHGATHESAPFASTAVKEAAPDPYLMLVTLDSRGEYAGPYFGRNKIRSFDDIPTKRAVAAMMGVMLADDSDQTKLELILCHDDQQTDDKRLAGWAVSFAVSPVEFAQVVQGKVIEGLKRLGAQKMLK